MKDIPKKYNHLEVESNKYNWWINKELFKAGDNSKEPFTIVLPPPNVTGKLHLGHAWDTILQDIISRRKRMQGFDVLWLPGMDHAGIATQAKVDAKLQSMGTNRHEIGREKFLEYAWSWKAEYASIIREQWAKLGLGLDYSRERFTLDDELNLAVRHVFVEMYKKGLIYRSEKIINWDPKAKTALSNVEVVHKDLVGQLYNLKYNVVGSDKYLVIATTRPETIFGDTAVMVHPEDARYTEFIGKKVVIPGIYKEVPVIADSCVKIEFGTGVVKVTPAHDANDFEVGNRHNLQRIVCINLNGTMNEEAGEYNGMDRFECRNKLIENLKQKGLLVSIEEYTHSVGHSERTDVIVEPYLSKQWFVKMNELAANALLNQSTEDRINFTPERFEKIFTNWMEEVHDWCISRQLWWGHRIPAWYKDDEVYVGMEKPQEEGWVQDEDVLDTWFSSALWPFSALGWPNEKEDFKRYFPTDVLVTGYDIIFFWVSRMIFQSLQFTDKGPFKDLLIHGLVRDSQGRKMTKSLGNGVDPMTVIEKYGADSLRYYLTTSSSPGEDLCFAEEKIEFTWNFINKLWNASRFVIMNIGDLKYEEIEFNELSVVDKWILSELNETISKVNSNMDKYEFVAVGHILYSFIWNDFCNWYIEMSKLQLNSNDRKKQHTTKSVLAYTLLQIIKLIHPFMPFVTEEIYQSLPHQEETICISKWPCINDKFNNKESINTVKLLIDVIRSVRNIRSELEISLGKPIKIYIKAADNITLNILNNNKDYIKRFCNPSELLIDTNISIQEKSMSAAVVKAEIYVPLTGIIDVNAEIQRLELQMKELTFEVERCSKMLANEKFIQKAPKEKVNLERRKLEEYQDKLLAITKRINQVKA